MQLAIIQNPHVKDPKELWRILNQRQENIPAPRPEKFDAVGFDLLKSQLSGNPRFIIK